ncbi:uncharacterized protein LOC116341195 isoform X2 [Contarinia nasturtii]|uniref:uncharacterized protein LOC116341195 isoform X2 n=1 Tax=Contarinia nasturtii TaxID=265458 RepID=UPI0012D3A1E3|nr:uncharacterized protein LOC116341195 isoform X2 [Contarinia nasturtii]
MKPSIRNMVSVRKYIGVTKFPSINWILCVAIWMLVFISCNESASLKRSASPDFNAENSESGMDRINVSYDEYPMVVPKRAAMLLDRIMVALHHALEDNDREGIQRIADMHKVSRHPVSNVRLQKEFMQQFKAGTENDLNYFDLPIDFNVETMNEIEGTHSTDETMGLQRRGHGEALGTNKNRVYWRCYFNAVTCF